MYATQHYTEYVKEAKAAEEAGNNEQAATLYERAIKQEPLMEQPYNRLMIIYRKNKQYKDELRIIDKAIEIYKAHYDKKKEPFKGSNTVGKLSKALLKTLGGDKKASKENSYPEPVPKWVTRKTIVEKKLK